MISNFDIHAIWIPWLTFFTIIDRILGKNPRTNDKFIIIVKKLLFLF